MTMRISGIASGLDTDSMVQELVKASSKKKDDLVKAQTRLDPFSAQVENTDIQKYIHFLQDSLII